MSIVKTEKNRFLYIKSKIILLKYNKIANDFIS